MRRAAIAAALALVGCANPVRDAQDRLAIVSRSGTADEKCSAARDVQQAYLRARDDEGYRRAHVTADIYCQSADLVKHY